MAEKSAVDILNAHHDKLNLHTSQINAMIARIDELEKRVGLLELDNKPLKDFVTRMNDWVGKIKDMV